MTTESTKVNSTELVEKALAAAMSAIELYNKPDFKYREETFSILMTNGWELLLKAKFLSDHKEDFTCLIITDKKGTPKTTRSGSALTHEVTKLANILATQKGSGVDPACLANLELLIEIRDTAIHFINRDIYFSRRVQDVGTAALRNFMSLAVT